MQARILCTHTGSQAVNLRAPAFRQRSATSAAMHCYSHLACAIQLASSITALQQQRCHSPPAICCSFILLKPPSFCLPPPPITCRSLTFWEQIDDGVQGTATRKFFTVVPVVLFLLASHGADFRRQPLGLNLLVVVVLTIAKMSTMHKVRIFGINRD